MYKYRSFQLGISIMLVLLIFIVRLFFLQFLEEKYALQAERISLRKQTIYPERGLIFDRNENLLVSNEPVYDLMMEVPVKKHKMDTLLLCHLLDISKSEFLSLSETAKKNAYRQKAVFKKNIPKDTYVAVKEQLFNFQGYFFEVRNDRKYKYNSGSHIFGYLGEVNNNDLELQEDDYYEQGDFKGKKGVEIFYENFLRGSKGCNYVYVDKYGASKGSYKEGTLDNDPVDGKNLHLSIDIDLQMFGEKLLQNKMGSVVAIDPGTGEILALISSPYYNPSDFTIQNRGKHYSEALKNEAKPLYNRAVSAPYPPGSIFKPVMSLIALGDDIIQSDYTYGCRGYYPLGNKKIKCHPHPFSTGVEASVSYSCNSFYCSVFKLMMTSNKYKSTADAYNSWYRYLNTFGIGKKLNVDISGEVSGWLRTSEYYDKVYGKNAWNYAYIISLAFGQGELGLTPLQMANFTSTIANRGYYYPPHVVRHIEKTDSTYGYFANKVRTNISPSHFEQVINGMRSVLSGGTATASAIPGIEIAGKTGTVQNPHGKNHSSFIAFAPVDSPRIAIAVVVEESGYGASWAAPIATLMIERFITKDSISKKPHLVERLINANLMPTRYSPVAPSTSNSPTVKDSAKNENRQ